MLGNKNKPFFIAEISSNHNGSLINAKKLINVAKKNGADVVKLQTYTPKNYDHNSKKKYFQIKSGLWKGYTFGICIKEHKLLTLGISRFLIMGKINGIKVFSTPFDETAVTFLEKLNCPFYKLASFEMKDIPLIKKVASTKKN